MHIKFVIHGRLMNRVYFKISQQLVCYFTTHRHNFPASRKSSWEIDRKCNTYRRIVSREDLNLQLTPNRELGKKREGWIDQGYTTCSFRKNARSVERVSTTDGIEVCETKRYN